MENNKDNELEAINKNGNETVNNNNNDIENNEENTDENKNGKKCKKDKKKNGGVLGNIVNILKLSVIILVLLLVTFFALKFTSREGKVIITVSSVLKSERAISELSTLTVPYNSVYTVTETKNDKTEIIYHVAYDGMVTLGIDFNAIEIIEDEENKVINIKLPDVVIQNVDVDFNSIKKIIKVNKYDTEDFEVKVYPECKKDLENKVNNTPEVFKMAKQSTEDSIKKLTSPLLDMIDSDYTIKFEWSKVYEEI